MPAKAGYSYDGNFARTIAASEEFWPRLSFTYERVILGIV
jgi:hypothetical protein